MKTGKRVGALLLALGLLMTLLTGCESLFQPEQYRSYEKLAEQVQDGREFTKAQVEEMIGSPMYYQGKSEGVDYMSDEIAYWKYETTDYSGCPWRFVVCFDLHGYAVSVQFYAIPAG